MNLGLLLFRLLIGLTIAAHGSQKLFGALGGGGLDATAAFFEQHLGFKPGRRFALMAGVAEFGGGLALALGLLTPVASACLIGVMVVAGAAAHGRNGFFITKGGYEYTAVLAGAAALFAFAGPGRVSFDHALGWDLWGNVWGIAALVLGAGAGAALLMSRGRRGEGDDEGEGEFEFDGDELDASVDATQEILTGGREAGLDRSEAVEAFDAETAADR